MSGRCTRQRGASIVEWLVGMTLGLIVVSTASRWLVIQHRAQQTLVAEQRLMHDLRLAADVIVSDLARAGYARGAWQLATPRPATNVYAALAVSASGSIDYRYSRDADVDNWLVDTGSRNEQFGFSLLDGVLRSATSGAWQPFTDPSSLVVTAFEMHRTEQRVGLGAACSALAATHNAPRAPCCRPHPSDATRCVAPLAIVRDGEGPLSVVPATGTVIAAACPELRRRHIDIILRARASAPHQAIERTWQQTVSLRNEVLDGELCS